MTTERSPLSWLQLLLLVACFATSTLASLSSQNEAAHALQTREETKEAEKKEEPPKKPELTKWYYNNENVFVTPKSHPGLFSFNGRWVAWRETFYASTWPATSVRILVYGPECTFKLRAPIANGSVSDHRFYVAVDGISQFVLSLPEYSAQDNAVFDVKIDLNQVSPGLNITAQPLEVKMNTPHVVELMSDENTPVHLIGVSMLKHSVLRQGQSWINQQDKIPHIEYVADKVSAYSASLNQSAMYSAARELGLRSSYIYKEDVCFSSHCGSAPAGLNQQYSWLSPFNGAPVPEDARMDMPSFYVFNRVQPLFRTVEPEWVIVDVGDNDLHRGVDGPSFMADLQLFLGQLVTTLRPESSVFVLIRDGRYVAETEDAIYSMRNSRIHAIKFGTENKNWYKSFLCTYVIPFADSSFEGASVCGSHYHKLSPGHALFSKVLIFILILFFVAVSFFFIAKRRAAIESFFRSRFSSYTPVLPNYSSKQLPISAGSTI